MISLQAYNRIWVANIFLDLFVQLTICYICWIQCSNQLKQKIVLRVAYSTSLQTPLDESDEECEGESQKTLNALNESFNLHMTRADHTNTNAVSNAHYFVEDDEIWRNEII